MKLHNSNFSPNALRVRAVAHELGVPLEIVEVNLRAGANRTPDFLALNPNAKVPVLEDGDFVLWESRAICAYLAGLKPEAGLLPTDLKVRGTVDQWSYWQAIHLGPAMQKLAFELVLKEKFGMGSPDSAAVEAERKNVAQFLAVLEKGLDGKDWIAGTLTVADFYLASTFALREPSGVSLADHPNVARWIARLEKRPSWQAAVEPMLKAWGG
jgi:glutathione S-transferase